MLVHHIGEVPESLPVTEETRERLRAQANQLGEATVLRLCDLLAVAVEDMRQGGDPRLPLELALVKVTRPGADLSAESMAYRLELLEQRGRLRPSSVGTDPERSVPEETPEARRRRPSRRRSSSSSSRRRGSASVLPAVERRSIPAASMLGEAQPVALADDTLTLEFPRERRSTAGSPRSRRTPSLLRRRALRGHRPASSQLEFAIGENGERARRRSSSRRARRTSSRSSRRPSTRGRWTS